MQLFNILNRQTGIGDPGLQNDALLFYSRTPADREIDFVSEHLGGVAIESKYTESGGWRSESRTLISSEIAQNPAISEKISD